MSNEYDAAVRELIARSLEAARQGRYAYICIQYDDGEKDHTFTYRSDHYQKGESIEIEDEH